MLPKVATHILHTTSRAAAAVQNQTHTIRNVFQLQHSSAPSSASGNLGPWNGPGSSHWGGNGTGAGSTKYNTGSRYNGYTNTTRSVTQANAITSSDGTFAQTDDADESAPKRVVLHTQKKTRSRSHSLSITGSRERGEKMGVLKTVQLHARSRHAFAQLSSQSTSDNLVVSDSHDSSIAPASRPVLVRRNSSSAPLSSSIDASSSSPAVPAFIRRNSTSVSASASATDSVPPPSPAPVSSTASGLSPTDPAAPQTTTPPTFRPDSEAYLALRTARDSHDPVAAAEAVRQFRQTTTKPSLREFNMALEALNDTRRTGDPLHPILETYNDLLKHGLLPNARTYITLIHALTMRDHEIQRLIHSLSIRAKRFELSGRPEVLVLEADQRRIESLKSENNFDSAMSLFEALLSAGWNGKCPTATYLALLRSCAYRSSVDGAIHVFAQHERRKDLKPVAAIYKIMIQVYTNAGEIAGAEEIFGEFLKFAKEGRLEWAQWKDPVVPRRAHLEVWNQMIEAYFRAGMPDKAVGLVDQMMNTTAGTAFTAKDIPPPASSTFTAVLSGFCHMGDVSTALAWFDRLLQERQNSDNPYESISGNNAAKPDSIAWMVMLDALATKGMVDELNRVYILLMKEAASPKPIVELRMVDRFMVFTANMSRIKEVDDALAQETLEFLKEHVLVDTLPRAHMESMIRDIWDEYLRRGMFEPAVANLMDFVGVLVRRMQEQQGPASAAGTLQTLQSVYEKSTQTIYGMTKGDVPFGIVVQLARIADVIKFATPEHLPYFLHSYGLAKKSGQVPEDLSVRDWEILLSAALEVAPTPTTPEFAFEGVVPLLEDLAARGITFDQVHASVAARTVNVLLERSGAEQLREVFTKLGPSFVSVLDDTQLQYTALEQALSDGSATVQDSTSQASSPTLPDIPRMVVDSYQTKTIDDVLKKHQSSPVTATEEAFKVFSAGIERGKAPTPATIGRLIQGLGRLRQMSKVRELYSTAQTVLMSLEINKPWQAEAWFSIEDSMIIALAHAGDVDSAHVHRARILDQGGAPSADAYGALILHVKDTTDDTSNAMALFQECQMRGVVPNMYLYNNIISKLAKARKADYALELFQQMKGNRIFPSSITYGAVIGACARVGDVLSAESLFSEMVQARNFKPRVPPYNTMIQLYTTTKPNRERALYFFNELRNAGVAPTAHTYKLLMDAYGAIEPVDIVEMEKVFQALQNNMSVEIQGNHFASLINAYGCVLKDLDKAISVFDSIPSYPRAQAPDAVVFEAMINALVANRRTDLMPEYITKMTAAGVHMTAYIANFLIKGYSIVGDLEQARAVFESLVDPAEGMAAPNNRASHEAGDSPAVGHLEPVYREPSTWEAMVRAELGSGNREQALELLERLKARKYPEAVYNRISGIMVDHSMVLP